jgi:uncharacterized protein
LSAAARLRPTRRPSAPADPRVAFPSLSVSLPSLLFFCLFFCSAALAGSAQAAEGEFVAIPRLSGPVVDQADVLSPGAERAITDLARELEQKTGAELAVLTVPSTEPEDVFGYGMRVLEEWKLGKRGVDDGLLFLFAIEDRKLHIFTGYALEGILPDGRVGEIRDTFIVPAFRSGEYDRGVTLATRAAAEIIAADKRVRLSGEPLPRGRGAPDVDLPPWLLLLIFLLFVLPALLGRGRRRRGFAPIFFGGGLAGAGRGGFGGGFGGGRGFGGGGSFGGGGAGGRW